MYGLLKKKPVRPFRSLFGIFLISWGCACSPSQPSEESQQCAPEEGLAQESEGPGAQPLPPAMAGETPLQRDLGRICNAESLSGALDLPIGDRAMHTGIWLAGQIETREGRELCSQLRALKHQERIAKLGKELEKNPVADCEILERWSRAED